MLVVQRRPGPGWYVINGGTPRKFERLFFAVQHQPVAGEGVTVGVLVNQEVRSGDSVGLFRVVSTVAAHK